MLTATIGVFTAQKALAQTVTVCEYHFYKKVLGVEIWVINQNQPASCTSVIFI
jgi:hypothetical protein